MNPNFIGWTKLSTPAFVLKAKWESGHETLDLSHANTRVIIQAKPHIFVLLVNWVTMLSGVKRPTRKFKNNAHFAYTTSL